MNIGNIKPNDQGIYIGRVQTMAFVATIALQAVNSNNERAPAYDVMALAADRRSWVKVGALWQYNSSETGEAFLSGRLDDPSLEKPIDVALFEQEDGSFNVAWRRPQRKRTLPTMADGDDLPPLSATGDEQGQDSGPSGNAAGDGLGDSTAPAPKGKAKTGSKQKETADA